MMQCSRKKKLKNEIINGWDGIFGLGCKPLFDFELRVSRQIFIVRFGQFIKYSSGELSIFIHFNIYLRTGSVMFVKNAGPLRGSKN
jgi:hypothetical protein